MKNIFISSILLFLFFTLVNGICAEDRLVRDFRVRLGDNHISLICRAKNISETEVLVHRLKVGANIFLFTVLQDPGRREFPYSEPSGGHARVRIQPDQLRQWEMESRRDYEFLHYGVTGPAGEGVHVYLNWSINWGRSPQNVLLGLPAEDGSLRPPVVDPDNPEVEVYLGFIYREEEAPEVCFLFLNGTGNDIAIEKPLTRESRIVASAPVIDYTHELVIPEAEVEEAVVASGKVGEWRMPWQAVYELIPEEDLEKIKAAGGDLDLLWQVGDYESDPLPISLSDPADNE